MQIEGAKLTLEITLPLLARGGALVLNFFFWGVAFVLAILHLYFLLKYKIDLPIADEWGDFANARGFSRDLTLKWVFATTNSHPMLGQRILSWFFLLADGRNFRTQAIVQFMALVPITFGLLRIGEKRLKMPLGWAALMLFTSLHAANYFWPFMVYLYIHFLLTVIGLFLVCCSTPRKILIGYAISALASLQAGSGLATGMAVVVYGAFLCWKVRRDVHLHLLGMGLVLVTIVAWLLFVPRDNPFILVNGPWTPQYWGFIGSALASGLGIGYPRFDGDLIFYTTGIGLLILAVGLVLSYEMGVGTHSHALQSTILPRFALGLFLVSLSAVLLAALSRQWQSGFFVLRYHIISLQVLFGLIALLLVYVSMTTWRIETKRAVTAGITTMLVLASIPNMQVSERYSFLGKQALEQLRCARTFFSVPDSKSCDEGPYERDAAHDYISNAATLGASFCRSVVDRSAPIDSIGACFQALQAKRLTD